MLTHRFFNGLALTLLLPLFAGGTPDNLVDGQPIYVVGEAPPMATAWTPGDAAFRLMDDGSGGDGTADDNVYTREITGLTPGLTFKWCARMSSGTWQAPGWQVTSTVPADGRMVFHVRTVPFADGGVPEVSGALDSPFAWGNDVRSTIAAASEIAVVGDFQQALGGVSWSATDPHRVVMTDAAAGVLGDGLYGATLAGLPGRGYSLEVALNQSLSPLFIGMHGYADGGGAVRMLSLGPASPVSIVLQADTGRLVVAPHRPAHDSPPFYALCSAWGEGLTAVEDMGAMTTGRYQKVFAVGTPGNYLVRVATPAGTLFPPTGGVPFSTSAPGQQVRVFLDLAQWGNGTLPDNGRLFVLDATTYSRLQAYSYVQVVGDFQADCGGVDWTPATHGAEEAHDDGATATDGDYAAGDGTYACRLVAVNGGGTRQVKVVAQRTGIPSDALPGNEYDCQFGGDLGSTVGAPTQPMTITYAQGDTLYFQVDTATGRVAIGVNYNPPRPFETCELVYCSVPDWTMFP